MTVRPLYRSDLPFLVSARETFSDAWDENMINSAFRAGNFYGFIAEDGAPKGFITYSVNTDAADLQDLFVIEDYRKTGAGNALIAAFISDARDRGVKKLFLEVRETNAAAIRLYEKAGFTRISVRKKYYRDGENALIYIKEI